MAFIAPLLGSIGSFFATTAPAWQGAAAAAGLLGSVGGLANTIVGTQQAGKNAANMLSAQRAYQKSQYDLAQQSFAQNRQAMGLLASNTGNMYTQGVTTPSMGNVGIEGIPETDIATIPGASQMLNKNVTTWS